MEIRLRCPSLLTSPKLYSLCTWIGQTKMIQRPLKGGKERAMQSLSSSVTPTGLAFVHQVRVDTGIKTGLFSAALAALISVSIQGLQPSSQNTSAFYLRNIYHVLANSTTSQPIVLPSPLSFPPHPIHLNFLPRNPLSWSTRSGS
jgi:hypothetical protein